MNQFKLFSLVVLALLFGSTADAQQTPTPAQLRADSLQRVILHDSLGLSESVANQVLALRDTCLHQVDRVSLQAGLTPTQQNAQIQSYRRQAILAIKELLGAAKYEEYMDQLSRQ